MVVAILIVVICMLITECQDLKLGFSILQEKYDRQYKCMKILKRIDQITKNRSSKVRQNTRLGLSLFLEMSTWSNICRKNRRLEAGQIASPGFIKATLARAYCKMS